MMDDNSSVELSWSEAGGLEWFTNEGSVSPDHDASVPPIPEALASDMFGHYVDAF